MENSLRTACVLTLSLHLLLCSTAEGLMCYQCDSSEDIRCSEELVGLDLKPQPCNPFSESKYCVTMTGIFGGSFGFKRFCSENFLDNYCTYVNRPGDQRKYRSCVHTCTGDGCNR